MPRRQPLPPRAGVRSCTSAATRVGGSACRQSFGPTRLQDEGLDTLDANIALGLPVDAREYGAAVADAAGPRRLAVRLLSSNPDKEAGLESLGMRVVRIGLRVPPTPENLRYLRTKHERMGHDSATSDDGWDDLLAGRVPSTGELAGRYGPLWRSVGRLVIAQLGQSLDGFIAARSGDAEFVTGSADREHLHRMRALVDAVVVGVGTVVADDPRLTVRAVRGRHPVRVLLDPNGRAPADAHLLSEPDAPHPVVRRGRRSRRRAPAPHVEVVRGCGGPAPGPASRPMTSSPRSLRVASAGCSSRAAGSRCRASSRRARSTGCT